MTTWLAATADVAGTFLTATVIPASLFVTLLMVRLISHLWYVGLNRRALPVVVNDAGQWLGSAADSGLDLAGRVARDESLADLPCLLREYVATDPPMSRQLAPDVAVAVSPDIPWTVPGAPQSGWPAALVNLILPQKQAAYNIFITSHHGASDQLTASVEVVKAPEHWMLTSKTFAAATAAELVMQAGGFCMEAVQLQPGFLRRTPRWEQWGDRGGYTLFRKAVLCQQTGDTDAAHKNYRLACRIAPGNIKLGMHWAGMCEHQGRFSQASLLYDMLHSLWPKNLEITYRAASVRVNLVQDILDRQGLGIASPDREIGRAGQVRQNVQDYAEAGVPALLRAQRQLDEAGELLGLMAADLHFHKVLGRWLSTWIPGQRDMGERRYWLSWLRSDSSNQPLGPLRRSKGYEYKKIVQITIQANTLLELIVQSEITARSPGALTQPTGGRDRFDPDRSVRSVLAVIGRKRAGWLARWTAACYFSRAALVADVAAPRDWQKIERRWRRRRSAGYPVSSAASSSWRECCADIAIGQIGRVLRNPGSHLDPDLLQTDPDMTRLRHALKDAVLAALIWPDPDREPAGDPDPIGDSGPISEFEPGHEPAAIRGRKAFVGM